jgi:hypothetical protein
MNSQCIIWPAGKDRDGYGMVRDVHREVMKVACGRIVRVEFAAARGKGRGR